MKSKNQSPGRESVRRESIWKKFLYTMTSDTNRTRTYIVSGYGLFRKHTSAELKEQNFPGNKQSQVSVLWKKLPDDEKKSWNEMARIIYGESSDMKRARAGTLGCSKCRNAPKGCSVCRALVADLTVPKVVDSKVVAPKIDVKKATCERIWTTDISPTMYEID